MPESFRDRAAFGLGDAAVDRFFGQPVEYVHNFFRDGGRDRKSRGGCGLIINIFKQVLGGEVAFFQAQDVFETFPFFCGIRDRPSKP